MKRLVKITLLSAFALQALSASIAMASDSATCKVATNDIGTIVGKGKTKSAAFEDAAVKCFDRREQLYKMKTNQASLDEDSGMVMIDACANIKCGV
jgi:hypothetical protein